MEWSLRKTQKDRVQRASGLVTLWKLRESGAPTECGSSESFSYTLPHASLTSAYSWVMFIYNRLVILWVNWFPEFCETPYKINQTQGWRQGNLWSIVRNAGHTLKLRQRLMWGEGQSCGTQSWICGIWSYVPVDSVRTKVNCSTPSWCPEHCLLEWRPLPPPMPNTHTEELVIRAPIYSVISWLL